MKSGRVLRTVHGSAHGKSHSYRASSGTSLTIDFVALANRVEEPRHSAHRPGGAEIATTTSQISSEAGRS